MKAGGAHIAPKPSPAAPHKSGAAVSASTPCVLMLAVTVCTKCKVAQLQGSTFLHFPTLSHIVLHGLFHATMLHSSTSDTPSPKFEPPPPSPLRHPLPPLLTHPWCCSDALEASRSGNVEVVAVEGAVWGLLELMCVGAPRSEGFIAEVCVRRGSAGWFRQWLQWGRSGLGYGAWGDEQWFIQ